MAKIGLVRDGVKITPVLAPKTLLNDLKMSWGQGHNINAKNLSVCPCFCVCVSLRNQVANVVIIYISGVPSQILMLKKSLYT